MATKKRAGSRTRFVREFKINNLGYDVRRIETERSCFEAEIVDRGSGGGVKATFSRANGELLWAKLAS
jgi:hypothetical protein